MVAPSPTAVGTSSSAGTRAAGLVLAAAVCFGTTGTAQTFAPDGAGPVSVGAARLVLGGLLLALVGGVVALRARAEPRPVAPHPGRPGRPAATRRTAALVALAALAMVAYQPAFFVGTRANGVAVGTLVALGSGPLVAGALEWAVLRRRPSRRWAVATAVAVLGVALLALAPGAGAGPLGLLASLGAGVSYAVYAVATKVLLEAGWPVLRVVPLVFGAGALLALPILLAGDVAWLATGAGAGVALWLGVVTLACGYLLFAAGLRHLPAATAATLTLAEPVTAGLLGVLVLHEVLPPQAWLGVGAVVLAVVLLSAPARRRPAVTTTPVG
ncbi:DMT family transporter [Litorihabitans aurantiacus]|uniref:Transporter YwfM n=1 Tax=Litorihabitans aurantiacus TaxID=1930061 RepID=A0AA37UHN4_9MICO|nr:EamA family transporter [Litorihabitans aurantiacus]GMA30918.1 putative transporter YwfM [Litorihabitans aurantiacus]